MSDQQKQIEKVKKEVSYHIQNIDCCSNCVKGEGCIESIYCSLIDDYINAFGICIKHERI